MKATDHLIAQGYVDPARMAAAGGSYGGFLVNWIAGHTDRFKALVSHAGVYSSTACSRRRACRLVWSTTPTRTTGS